MVGLVPTIHVFIFESGIQDVDARHKGEHDGGEMTGKLFLNGQLGDEQDTVTAAATGTLDFSIVAINNITPFSPSVGTLTLPYVILSQDDAEKVTQGEVGEKMIAQELENIPNEKTRSIAKGYVEKVAHGERDFRF